MISYKAKIRSRQLSEFDSDECRCKKDVVGLQRGESTESEKHG